MYPEVFADQKKLRPLGGGERIECRREEARVQGQIDLASGAGRVVQEDCPVPETQGQIGEQLPFHGDAQFRHENQIVVCMDAAVARKGAPCFLSLTPQTPTKVIGEKSNGLALFAGNDACVRGR